MKAAVMRSPSMSHKQGIKGKEGRPRQQKSECAYKLHTHFNPDPCFQRTKIVHKEESGKMNCWFHSVASISTQS